MATYEAGDLTKQKIFDAAKKLFYEKGYADTTMKEVCAAAGVRQSVFYYHYKDKKEIAEKLYVDFGERHMSAILDLFRTEHYSSAFDGDIALNNCITMALFFKNSFEDENLNRFWAQMYTENQPEQLEWYRHRYYNMFRKSPLAKENFNFDFFLTACTSINGPLMMGYYNKTINADAKEIIRFKVEHTLRQLRYPEEKVQAMTDSVLETAYSLPLTAGENFEIFVNGKAFRIAK